MGITCNKTEANSSIDFLIFMMERFGPESTHSTISLNEAFTFTPPSKSSTEKRDFPTFTSISIKHLSCRQSKDSYVK